MTATSVPGPGGIVTVSPQLSCKELAPSLLWPHGSYRLKPHWLSKLAVLGPISQMEVLKVGAPEVVFKPFSPQRDAGSCEFPLHYV